MNSSDRHDTLTLADGHATHRHAAQVVAAGGVIAFRTDTFYGLGADPFNRDALAVIKTLKGRGDDKPILVVISDPHVAVRFLDAPSPLYRRARGATLAGRADACGVGPRQPSASIDFRCRQNRCASAR